MPVELDAVLVHCTFELSTEGCFDRGTPGGGCLRTPRLRGLALLSALQGYCPCEETCSNQMFSKKQYARLEKVSASCRAAQHKRTAFGNAQLARPRVCAHAT